MEKYLFLPFRECHNASISICYIERTVSYFLQQTWPLLIFCLFRCCDVNFATTVHRIWKPRFPSETNHLSRQFPYSSNLKNTLEKWFFVNWDSVFSWAISSFRLHAPTLSHAPPRAWQCESTRWRHCSPPYWSPGIKQHELYLASGIYSRSGVWLHLFKLPTFVADHFHITASSM